MVAFVVVVAVEVVLSVLEFGFIGMLLEVSVLTGVLWFNSLVEGICVVVFSLVYKVWKWVSSVDWIGLTSHPVSLCP